MLVSCEQSIEFATTDGRRELGQCAVFNSREDECEFLLTVMPRPHQVTGALMGCNHKVSNPIRIESWKRDPDFVRLLLLTPTAITLQFQGVRELGTRRNAACGICARAVVAKLVRCQGRHDE